MATAARTRGPKTRKARPVPGRASTNFINSNDTSDTTLTARLQFLSGLGLSGTRGLLLSGLIWEGSRHG